MYDNTIVRDKWMLGRLNLQRLRISQRTSCPIMPHPNMAIRKGSSSNDDEVIVKLLLDVCGGL